MEFRFKLHQFMIKTPGLRKIQSCWEQVTNYSEVTINLYFQTLIVLFIALSKKTKCQMDILRKINIFKLPG